MGVSKADTIEKAVKGFILCQIAIADKADLNT
jgi:hypothetical protein